MGYNHKDGKVYLPPDENRCKGFVKHTNRQCGGWASASSGYCAAHDPVVQSNRKAPISHYDDCFPGVLPRAASRLLRLGYRNLEAVRHATDEQLFARRGIGRKGLESIRDALATLPPEAPISGVAIATSEEQCRRVSYFTTDELYLLRLAVALMLAGQLQHPTDERRAAALDALMVKLASLDGITSD